jgi:hypothetical protein
MYTTNIVIDANLVWCAGSTKEDLEKNSLMNPGNPQYTIETAIENQNYGCNTLKNQPSGATPKKECDIGDDGQLTCFFFVDFQEEIVSLDDFKAKFRQ